ncbi:F-box/WD repeat-containing protein 7, partial [Elysia marginata]
MAGKKIDINTASVNDLEYLAGVGLHRAEAIVKHRKESGGFQNVVELSQVPGISPTIIDQNKGRIVCRAKASPEKRKSGPELPKRTTRQHNQELSQLLNILPSAHTPQQEAPSSGSSNSSSTFPSPLPSHFTRSQKAALLRLVGQPSCLSTDTPPAEPFPSSSSCRVTKRGGLNLHQANSSQEDDSGNDGDDERDERSAPTRGRDAVVREIPRDSSSVHVNSGNGLDVDREEDEVVAEGSDGECSISEGNQSYAESSASSHPEPLENEDCAEEDREDEIVAEDDDQNLLDNSFSSGGECHRACLGMSSRTRSNSSLKLEGESSTSTTSKQNALKRKASLSKEEKEDGDQETSPGKKLRMALLALYVLSFMEPRDLLRAAQTCRYWRVLAEDNLLWREKCREEGIDEEMVYGCRMRRRHSAARSPYKSLYMRQSQIEHNWRTGVNRPPKHLKGHDDHVITCLEFCGNRVVSGSDDNTLKVWSVTSGKCLRTLIGHTGGVWSSQMSGTVVISGSTDRTLKVWNAETGQCRHTLYGHSSTVRCMSLHENQVVSGSRDATLRVWDIDTGACKHILMGHQAAVRCVQFDGKKVVSGAYDYTVRVWDPETETCLHTLQGHSNRVYSLQ